MTDASDPATADVHTIPFQAADGTDKTLADYGDRVFVIVNVASKCGLTPQYEQLENLQRTYGDRGLTVLGFPCNQFFGQEPAGIEEILDYCATTWGVSFPVLDKVKVNGGKAAPLFKALKRAKDASGKGGPVKWNFEKFVLAPSGEVHRFRPTTKPDDPQIIRVIEENLPG